MRHFIIPEGGITLKILEGSTFTRHGKASMIQTNIDDMIVTKIHRASFDIFDQPRYSWFIGEERIMDSTFINLLEEAYDVEIKKLSNCELSDVGMLERFYNCKIGELISNKPFDKLSEGDFQKLRSNVLYPKFFQTSLIGVNKTT